MRVINLLEASESDLIRDLSWRRNGEVLVRQLRHWSGEEDAGRLATCNMAEALSLSLPLFLPPCRSNRADELSRSVTFSWKITPRGAARRRQATAPAEHVVRRKSRYSRRRRSNSVTCCDRYSLKFWGQDVRILQRSTAWYVRSTENQFSINFQFLFVFN